jgi:hypothetical protein
MKRIHSVNDLKAAAPAVADKIRDAKSGLSSSASSALDDMMQLAMEHAQEISVDEASVIEAGVGGKVKSTH